MSKVIRTQNIKKGAKKKGMKDISLPFTKDNYIILSIGVLVIIIGFILMELGGAYDALSLVISPIILVIGYCVIVPFSIFYRKKNRNEVKTGKI